MTNDDKPEKSNPPKKVRSVSQGWAKPDDPIYTGGRKVKSISLGLMPDDDPIYENSGWNFIMGKNLNPKFNKADEKKPK